jgi:hypothetical protein
MACDLAFSGIKVIEPPRCQRSFVDFRFSDLPFLQNSEIVFVHFYGHL